MVREHGLAVSGTHHQLDLLTSDKSELVWFVLCSGYCYTVEIAFLMVVCRRGTGSFKVLQSEGCKFFICIAGYLKSYLSTFYEGIKNISFQ